MRVEISYAIAVCALIVGTRTIGLFTTAGLIRSAMRISESAVGTYDAYNNADYLNSFKEISKVALDIILVVGIGRMLDCTGRVPLRYSAMVVLLGTTICTYVYLGPSVDITAFVPWTGRRM